MNEHSLEQIVRNLAEPVVHALGLQVWGVEISQAGRTIVRLFVDVPPGSHALQEDTEAAPGSASIDQCEDISRHLGLALEVEDVISAAYVLEVSTPGLSRRFFSLAQMPPYVGDMMEARLLASHEGRRIWRGLLQACEDDTFVLAPATLTPEGDIIPEDVPPVRLQWSAVRRVSRIHIFRQPVKPGKGPGKGATQGAGRKKGSGRGTKGPHRDFIENTSSEDRGEA